MPLLMSLEGPKVSPLADIRSQLYAATPRGLWRTQAMLNGLFDESTYFSLFPFKAHPLLLLAGLAGGIWLAGSKTGNKLTGKWFK